MPICFLLRVTASISVSLIRFKGVKFKTRDTQYVIKDYREELGHKARSICVSLRFSSLFPCWTLDTESPFRNENKTLFM